jgi:hypothetical protein
MSRPLVAFLHLAKTGGRTVDTVLRSTYGPGYVQAEPWRPLAEIGAAVDDFMAPTYGPEDLRRLRRLCPWLRAVGGHTITLWSGLHRVEPVRYVAFLREPIARGASHYQYHVATHEEPLDWDRWCAWTEHHQHQVRYFDRAGDPQAAIAAIEEQGVFVGLLERFEESLLLMRKLAIPELQCGYERRNTASTNNLARDLRADPAKVERLREMYAGEFPLYEWVRDVLWPRYEAAYGPGLAEDAARLKADPARGFRRWHDRAGRAQHRFWIEPWKRAAWRRAESPDS